jgi:hypothetical protein
MAGFTYDEFAELCEMVKLNSVRLGAPMPCRWVLDEGELVETGGRIYSKADTIVSCDAPATFGFLMRGKDWNGDDAWIVVPICPACCTDFRECLREAAGRERVKRERQARPGPPRAGERGNQGQTPRGGVLKPGNRRLSE